MKEAAAQPRSDGRRVKFRCLKCAAPIIGERGGSAGSVVCGYCGTPNTPPRTGAGPTHGSRSASDGWAIPTGVAHKPYLADLQTLSLSIRSAETPVAREQKRALRIRRRIVIGLVAANAAAVAAGVALIGSAAGWW